MEDTQKVGEYESIYMNIDEIEKNEKESGVSSSICQNTTTEKRGFEGDSEGRQVCCANPAAVCLGLFCVLLLAVITGLGIKQYTERKVWSNYINMTMERDQLQSRFINITKEKDQFWSSYRNVALQRDQLQSNYDSILKERDHILGIKDNLNSEKIKLRSSYDALAKDRDALQRKLKDIGWTQFMCSCYYISLNGKNWDESRRECIEKGADLVIINSREEQQFVSGHRKNLWIGLTDKTNEGQWTWVDGTLPEPGYWMKGEPNNAWNYGQGEDCAEAVPPVFYSETLAGWNDIPCNTVRPWICEKKIHS